VIVLVIAPVEAIDSPQLLASNVPPVFAHGAAHPTVDDDGPTTDPLPGTPGNADERTFFETPF
jgi:hypothetical protein